MGCFPCFDAKGEEKLNHHKERDDRKKVHPTVPSEVSGWKDFPRADTTSRTFTFRELANATHNFKPECLLRQGEFGRIYKGRLPNGQVVAVKQLYGNERLCNMKFLVEVLMLSLLSHPGIVTLMGCCADEAGTTKVLEFPRLCKSSSYPWGFQVIPHITRFMGTYVYSAPEYVMNGQLSVKSDVYSSGVVVLELITGRKVIDSTRPEGEQKARRLFNDRRKFAELADPVLQGKFPRRGLYCALVVAFMCIEEQAVARPQIRDVATVFSYLANQTFDPSVAPWS